MNEIGVIFLTGYWVMFFVIAYYLDKQEQKEIDEMIKKNKYKVRAYKRQHFEEANE